MQSKLEIEYWDITKLKPYPNNPRLNDDALQPVAESLREFGWRQPIVVDEAGVIVCGHTRYRAALLLELDTVPVHVAKDLTDTQIRAYRLADNKTAEIATWDFEILPIELSELRKEGVDLGLLGFEDIELEKILGVEIFDGKTDPDEVPDKPEVPKSKPGHLYQLGRHCLFVGDATSQIDYSLLMDDELADLIVTDPPYNVAYTGKTKDQLEIENDEMSDEDFRYFLEDTFRGADHYLKEGGSFYIWHADSEGYNFRGACRSCDWKVRQCLIWHKNIFVMGRQDYHWQHEPCLYGWKSGKAHNWYTDRKQSTVLNFDRPSRSVSHPTMKPVELFEYQIRNSSKSGDIVLDPFAGSGTTVIACERSNRRAFVMELDPKYADVIRKRWAEFVFGEGCDWEEKTRESTE